MNFTNQEKNIFKIVGYVIAGILIIGSLYFGISKVSDWIKQNRLEDRYELIETYKHKVDSIQKENTLLIKEINNLEYKVDSLSDVKSKIQTKYEIKINTIYDATPVDNAKWLDAILRELKNNPN